MEKYINGSTGLLCLIGSPVGHSGSPAMYNYSFRYNDQNLTYVAFDIKEDEVPEFIRLARLLNIRGFNATMPCKSAVARAVDELSPAARIIGACNTVVNDNGRFVGHMTDGAGFVLNLKDNGVDIEDKNIVLFGAGGAATAIFVECALSGAASISVYNRSRKGYEHILDTAEKIKAEGISCHIRAGLLSEKEAMAEDIKRADILINGTSVGMKPDEDASIVEDMSWLHKDLVVSDIVYNPRVTRLMKDAEAAGVKKIIGGEGMLLWQGAVAYKLYTGKDMPVEDYKRFKQESQGVSG